MTTGRHAVAALAAAWLLSACSVEAAPYYRGVNLAGGEFAPRKLPGEYARDYIYPDRRVAEPFLEAGMNAVRLPVLWERLQPEAHGELSAAEMEHLDASLAALAGFSLVVLDVHNYARYYREPLDAEEGARQLSDLWRRLAQRYADNPRIAFGIMNEPYGIAATTWRRIADQVVQTIRATGADNLILVPGTRWTGGHSWTHGGGDSNAAAFQGFRDPADNFVYEIHQYLDADSSGTSQTCVDPATARQRLAAVSDWLRSEGQRAVLGEFGAAANRDCLAALDALLTVVEDDRQAWQGWLYWAGGPWWGDYPMSIQPHDGEPRPQMRIMAQYLDGGD